MNGISRYIPLLDKFAITTSAFCAIHCLCLPILLVVFPALSATLFGEESFHVLLLWLVIPLSLVALSMGCGKHKNWFVALLGLTGLGVLVLAATLGHAMLGETGERILLSSGRLRLPLATCKIIPFVAVPSATFEQITAARCRACLKLTSANILTWLHPPFRSSPLDQ